MNKRFELTMPADAAIDLPAKAAEATRRKVVVLGLFPLPVNGQRIITQRMFEEISTATTAIRRDLDRFPRLGVLSKPLSALLAAMVIPVARAAGFSAMYLAPHSGIGLLYSSFLAAAARLFGYRLFVHYHSYRNVARHSPLMAMFLAACGQKAVHIVLAPPMEWGLRAHYDGVRRIEVLSNSVFIPPAERARTYVGPRIRIGHLSNLCREKGIEHVLECLRRLRAKGVEAEFVIAGPATDAATQTLITEAAAEFGEYLNYLGPVGRGEIQSFYESIDVFLFPTQYAHEAEPLVLIDALSVGVPVVATDRGCIGYLLEATGGCAFAADEFVERAVEQIEQWSLDRRALAATASRAQQRFHELHRDSKAHLSRLLGGILRN